MNLTEEPEIVQRPETHYAFFWKTRPFAKIAPEAWPTAHSLAARGLSNGAAEIRSTAQSLQLFAPSIRFVEKVHWIAQLRNMVIIGNA